MYKYLYYILTLISLFGTLPYRILSLGKVIVIFLINIFFLTLCAIAAVGLFIGIVIIKSIHFLLRLIYKGLKLIKSSLTYTGKFMYRYKLPLFTPIIFFTLLYCILFMISSVNSEEKQEFIAPKWVRIYDVNEKILYNGTLENYQTSQYKRAPEVVDHIIHDITIDNTYNVSNQEEVTIYTTIDLTVQNSIQEYFREKVDVSKTQTTGVIIFNAEDNKILGMVKAPEKTTNFKLISKISNAEGKKLYGGIAYLPF